MDLFTISDDSNKSLNSLSSVHTNTSSVRANTRSSKTKKTSEKNDTAVVQTLPNNQNSVTSDYNFDNYNIEISNNLTSEYKTVDEKNQLNGGGFDEDFMPQSGIFIDSADIKKLDDIFGRTKRMLGGMRKKEKSSDKSSNQSTSTSDNNFSSTSASNSISATSANKSASTTSASKSASSLKSASSTSVSNSVSSIKLTTSRISNNDTNTESKEDDSISDISSESESSISFGQDDETEKNNVTKNNVKKNARAPQKRGKKSVKVNIVKQGEYSSDRQKGGYIYSDSDMFTASG